MRALGRRSGGLLEREGLLVHLRELRHQKLALLLCVLLTPVLAFPSAAGAQAVPAGSSGPITITVGGTYTGTWTSTSSVPTIRIETSEPVTITNSTVTNFAGGTLIEVPAGMQADVTIAHVVGRGGNGRFVVAEGFKSVTVRNCTLDRTGGIYLTSPEESANVVVSRNRARNIQKGSGLRQFLQFNRVTTATVDVSWNEVVNVYGQSEVEDNISVYKSSHVVVHDNYIRGAYPRHHSQPFSGSGIVLADDGGSFNRAFRNQIVDTTNVGIGIVGGHDNEARNNRVVSDGRLDDGTLLAAANVGVVVWNAYGDPTWANNRATGNAIAWVHAGRFRNDMWFPHAPLGDYALNTNLRARVSRSTEVNEYRLWVAKLAAQRVQVGAFAQPTDS